MKIDIFVIDFDSTFVDRESVNLLLELAIKGHPRRADMANKLKILADLCMKSEVGFQEYFRMRIEIVKQALKEEHLLQVAEILKDKVSPDIIKLLDLVKKLGKKVIVISNSFKLIMKNLMEQYGIEIYFANKHIADKHGFIVGFDESNPLANDNGKENIVKSLKSMGFIQPEEKIMMVGDGMPDLRVYKEKLADYFLDFAINKNRKLKKHRIADDSKFIICRRHEDMDAFLQTVV